MYYRHADPPISPYLYSAMCKGDAAINSYKLSMAIFIITVVDITEVVGIIENRHISFKSCDTSAEETLKKKFTLKNVSQHSCQSQLYEFNLSIFP